MDPDVRSRLAAYRKEKQILNSETAPSKEQEEHLTGDSPPNEEEHGKNQDHGNSYPATKWWQTGLKIVLWLLLWGFFIEVEFGVVYFVVSGLVLLVLSLRGGSGKRAPGELSAYSVFNKNCEAIEGTLSAEQFERELRYGPSSVR